MLRTLLHVLVKFACRPRMLGEPLARLPAGAKLFIANHDSLLDGIVLAHLLPENTTFIVHKTVAESRVFGPLLSHRGPRR